MIRDIHLHVLAVKQYQSLFREFKPYCVELIGEGHTKAIQNIFANASFLHGGLTEIYRNEKDASKFLAEQHGISHIEEMALQVVEKGQEIINNYKV